MSQTKQKTTSQASTSTATRAAQSEMLRAYLDSGPTTASERLLAGAPATTRSLIDDLVAKSAQLDALARFVQETPRGPSA